MLTGWWYRAVSATGTTAIAMGATALSLFVTSGLQHGHPVRGADPLLGVMTAGVVVGLALEPMYRPRPRRVISTISTTLRRIGLSALVLTGIGVSIGVPAFAPVPVTFVALSLSVVLPFFYWFLRRRTDRSRVLIVGDDPTLIGEFAEDLPIEPLGLVSPEACELLAFRDRSDHHTEADTRPPSTETDGGDTTESMTGDASVGVDELDRLGGLSKLESILVAHDVDTVVLAFSAADRGEFFGAVAVACRNGVDILTLDSHANDLIRGRDHESSLIAIDPKPWPWYKDLAKRVFDVAFAAAGLLVFAPVIVVIGAAIKLDSPGPAFYAQTRTAEFGGRIRVLKFRTMIPESENPEPVDDLDNDRITRVGRVLRNTHADEIPQLWSVLIGDMSVVGPRAIWIDEERLLELEVEGWRARWFVKPGLTGLAQVNEVTSTAGRRKLALDLEYINNRTLQLEILIVLKQIRIVLADVGELVHGRLWSQDMEG